MISFFVLKYPLTQSKTVIITVFYNLFGINPALSLPDDFTLLQNKIQFGIKWSLKSPDFDLHAHVECYYLKPFSICRIIH